METRRDDSIENLNPGKKLFVGFAVGWGRDAKTKAGPMSDPVTEKIFSLSKGSNSPVLFVGGNGPWFDKESMLEADRMTNHFINLAKGEIQKDPSFEVPDVHSDTEDYLDGVDSTSSETAMGRSTSTVSNSDNVVRFLNSLPPGEKPSVIEVAGLDKHLPRVLSILRKSLDDAGYSDVKTEAHPIRGEYNETQGQWRLRDETRFKVWNALAGKVFQRGDQ